jgi:hypothetical protein
MNKKSINGRKELLAVQWAMAKGHYNSGRAKFAHYDLVSSII